MTSSVLPSRVIRNRTKCRDMSTRMSVECALSTPRASAQGHGATAQGPYGILLGWGGRQRVRTARGRLGPWGRRRCSVMLPIAGPCSAPHATSRPASLLQRFADLKVASSSLAGRASNNDTPREVTLGAFSFGAAHGPKMQPLCSQFHANSAAAAREDDGWPRQPGAHPPEQSSGDATMRAIAASLAYKAGLTGDGVVNFADLAKMKSVFFKTCTP